MNPTAMMGLFFLFVMGTVSVIGYVAFARREGAEEEERAPLDLLTAGEPQGQGLRASLVGMLHSIGESMPSSESSRGATQKRLGLAGYRTEAAITSYFGLKYSCGGVIGLLFCFYALQKQDDVAAIVIAIACGLGLGFLIPERFLDYLISSRNDRLRRALPPALDLLVMGMEAGQSLDQAMLLASRGLQKFSPDLAGELLTVYLETRASKSRAESIRHMAERNSEPEIRKFCALLLDSDRFGSSLAPTLRQHAKFLRVRYRQRAQEQARKLTVKMVFPVFFLIFPAILVVTLGPAVLLLMRQMSSLFQ
ncbi:MAG: type II secretion system F family protein [Acidobacteria bacterium]|nr:type II secretion system F family protein [Acidobacteriota bacterium]